MAPKRSRSAVSECSVRRKRGRGMRGKQSRGRGSATPAHSLPKKSVSRGGSARNASHRGRARGATARGCAQGATTRARFSNMDLDVIHHGNHSSDSEDSGPMSLDLAPTHNKSRFPSDLTIIDSPTDKSRSDEKLVCDDGLTVTDKLMSVVTSALPALEGELAAHVRGLLDSPRAHPLADMLRTLARFTNIIPNREKPAESETTAEGTTMEKSITKTSTTKDAEMDDTPVVSYLWTKSLAQRQLPDSDDTLVSTDLASNETSVTKYDQISHTNLHPTPPKNEVLAQQTNCDPKADTNCETKISNQGPITTWDLTLDMSRDLRLRKGQKLPAHYSGDPIPHIKIDLTSDLSEDPKSHSNKDLQINSKQSPHNKWDHTLNMSRSPRLEKDQDLLTHTNGDRIPHIKIDLTSSISKDLTQYTIRDPTPQINYKLSPQTKCDTQNIRLQKSQDLPTYRNWGANIKGDSTPKMICDLTQDIRNWGANIKRDSIPEMICDLTQDIDMDPTHSYWNPTQYKRRDPDLQKGQPDVPAYANEDSMPCIINDEAPVTNMNPTPLLKLEPTQDMNCEPTPLTNLEPTQDMNCEPTPLTNLEPTQDMNCEPTQGMYCKPTPLVPFINGDEAPLTNLEPTQGMNCEPTPFVPFINGDKAPHTNLEPTQGMNCEPTPLVPFINGDEAPLTNLEPTQDMNCVPTQDMNCNPTPNGPFINGDEAPLTKLDPTTLMKLEPTPGTSCEPTPHEDEELKLTDWDDDYDNKDIESVLRKINNITAIHEQTLQIDDDDLDNLFPAVSMPQKMDAFGRPVKPEPCADAARGARGRGGGRGRPRGARARRVPRERPDSPETVLIALQDAMIKANDIMSVASRPPQPTGIFQLYKETDVDAEEDEEMGVAETYADYKPAKLTIGKPHPDLVVETASLSSVESAEVTYKLSLPEETVEGGLLSALQLEAVVYASQAHEHVLPDGTRAGFLVGDGAGVGKGRTIAGIIFENYLKGRRRALWVSVSNDLKYDAERDLRDIGAGTNIKVYPLNKMNYSSILSASNGRVAEGVMFSTYSALIGFTASPSAEYKTRLKQLLAWCGPDFDGCIVFDECHRAKNLCPVTATKPSKTGLAVLNLQLALPKARLVYASATGASEPKNMAYMVRLGIWGEGTPFPSFKDFLVAVERRGVGAMEIVAMDLKLRGMYIARQLSFHGVTFKIEEVPLSPTFRATYDKAVELWVEAMQTFETGLELVNPSQKWRKVMWAQFWGAHQRFFKYLCIAAKVSCTVAWTNEAVRAGKCVVIGLQSTGEARTLDQLDRDDGKLTEFICTARGVFQSLVEKQFPDPDIMKDEESVPVSPVVRQQIKTMKKKLLKNIALLGRRLPANTLDQLVDELGGAENVAEMTGRKGRVVQTEYGQILYESRSEADVPLETLNLTEKQRFMDGEKNIAIISEAASSGISLQSDRRVKNHKRRVHITLELPWSADRAIQQFGRTHRSNQVNAPEYIFLISDLAGERRFASTVAKRLESLGALTHGDRRATETRDLSQFNIENKFGRAALRRMQRAVNGSEPSLVETPAGYAGDFLRDSAAALAAVGLDFTNDQDSADIQRFLNRLLGVPVRLQNALFQYFTETFVAIVQQAKRSGRFDLGILDLGSAGERVRRVRCLRFLRRHATGSAPVELHTVQSERGLEWEKADRKCSELCGRGEGFYLSRKRWDNKHNAILCVATNASHTTHAGATRTNTYHVYRPNTGLLPRAQTLSEIERNYTKASRLAAQAPWQAQYEQSLTTCSHRYWRGACSFTGCEVGLRVRTHHVLSGSVLTVWARLEAVMKQLHLSNRLQVVRVKTDQGVKIVGTLLPKCCVELLTEELKNEAISFTDSHF